MYPENPQHPLRNVKEATSKHYGYLLIDLKPTTSVHLRMRRDIFSSIKPSKTEHVPHYSKAPPNKQTHLQPSAKDQFSEQTETSIPFNDASNNQTYLKVPSTDQLLTSSENTKTDLHSQDMSSCDDCGLLFENIHDLQRHVKRW